MAPIQTAEPMPELLLGSGLVFVLSAPTGLFIRTADAVHLTTARDIGERDVWTSDRHMLGAGAYFGLRGRSV